MSDQNISNTVTKASGCLFIGLSVGMLLFGIGFAIAESKTPTENMLMYLGLAAGLLLLYAGVVNIRTAKRKQKALDNYLANVEAELQKKHQQSSASSPASSLPKNNANEDDEPQVLAQWQYTTEDWKLMRRHEWVRRWRESIWVTALITVLGTALIMLSREAPFLPAFLVSLCIGILINALKMLMSQHLLSTEPSNEIVITSYGLRINGRFKTVQDSSIQLEYVKCLERAGRQYLEFSIQWGTRNGVTNDQFRILVPPQKEQDVKRILQFYQSKGVSTT